jgi:hypothetical protein
MEGWMEGLGFRPVSRAFDLAIPEAEALGHSWLGEVHILLGISRTETRAGRALDAVGISHQRIQEAANELLKGSTSDPEGRELPKWVFNFSGAKAINWAEGRGRRDRQVGSGPSAGACRNPS